MSGFQSAFREMFNSDRFQFRIGDLSTMTGVSTRQLRYWEKKQLISSNPRIGNQDARVYGVQTYMRVAAIKYFLDEGYTLAGAAQKADDQKAEAKLLHQFINSSFQGIENLDGQKALNLGPFDENGTQTLYGFNNDGKITYKVLPKK